jgi:hypothetical protein
MTLLIAASPYSDVWVYVYMLFALWIVVTSTILIRGAGTVGPTGCRGFGKSFPFLKIAPLRTAAFQQSAYSPKCLERLSEN